MRIRASLSIILSLLFICSMAAGAAELTSDYQKDERRPPATVMLPAPPVRTRNPITDLVRHCMVSEGHYYRGLTIFPIRLRRYGLGLNPLTLDEALGRGTLSVMEKGGGEVPTLVIVNRGPEHVFIMAGEILVGGKQNRILRTDVLLTPYSGPIELPAYCVEAGRWVQNADAFKSDGNLASPQVRLEAQKAADQAAIWSRVEEAAKAVGQVSETHDFNYVYNQEEVARQIRDYRDEFCRVLPERIIGVVVARNGELVGADLFGDAGLFLKLRNKVLDSYAIDVLNRVQPPTILPDRMAAQVFLHRVLAAQYWTEPCPGAAVTGRAVGNGVDARGLIWSERAVHVSMFPAVTVMPAPIR